MEVLEFLVPSFYLPLLVNGDATGLTQDDLTAIKQFNEQEIGELKGHWSYNGDDDGAFYWHHDLTQYGIGGCDCQEINFVVMQ